jgi:hypothetical protein
MSKKLEELILAASTTGKRQVWFTRAEVEHIASLIISECIDKIETYHIPVGNSSSGELACEWTYAALKEIRDDIKECFGMV